MSPFNCERHMNVRFGLHTSTSAGMFFAILFPLATSSGSLAQQPAPMVVRHMQGTSHAFLTLRSESGAVIGYGELLQLVHGDRVSSRLTFHFRDGSVDDDVTDFTQRSTSI